MYSCICGQAASLVAVRWVQRKWNFTQAGQS